MMQIKTKISPLHCPLRPKWTARVSTSHLTKPVMAGFLLFIGFVYVLQMNLTATRGYEIRKLEDQVFDLQKQSQTLRLQAMDLQSMQRIIEQKPEQKLVKSDAAKYLSVTAGIVASR